MYIGDVARMSGLSVDTLRYYEKIGLIPAPLRDAAGRRVYDADIGRWLDFLAKLKATGMGIRDMVHYAELRLQGEKTYTERREMLEHHQAVVAQAMADLSACAALLDQKIDTYRRLEAEASERG